MPSKRFKPNLPVSRERKIEPPKPGRTARSRSRKPSQSSGNESDTCTPVPCLTLSNTCTPASISTDSCVESSNIQDIADLPSDSHHGEITPTPSLVRGVAQMPTASSKGKKKVAPKLVPRKPRKKSTELGHEVQESQTISPDPMNTDSAEASVLNSVGMPPHVDEQVFVNEDTYLYEDFPSINSAISGRPNSIHEPINDCTTRANDIHEPMNIVEDIANVSGVGVEPRVEELEKTCAETSIRSLTFESVASPQDTRLTSPCEKHPVAMGNADNHDDDDVIPTPTAKPRRGTGGQKKSGKETKSNSIVSDRKRRRSIEDTDNNDDDDSPTSRPKKPKNVRKKFHDAPDKSVMTMEELIYYNPSSNPMSSRSRSKDSGSHDNDTSSTREATPKGVSPAPSVGEDEGRIVPMLKIGLDGKIQIDESSIYVTSNSHTQGIDQSFSDTPTIEDESSYSLHSYNRRMVKKWTESETKTFYTALAQVGTDFTMMALLLPGRSRTELKNKFKREEKNHEEKIAQALKRLCKR